MTHPSGTNDTRLYNILFPLWILVWIPSWLWLILIPANYLFDRIIFGLSLKDHPDRKALLRKNTWKICIAGFLADFAGAGLMLGVTMLLQDSRFEETADAIMWNPFSLFSALLTVIAAVLLSGLLIFLIDRLILRKAGLGHNEAKKSALMLSLITAPYLFFIPAEIIYM